MKTAVLSNSSTLERLCFISDAYNKSRSCDFLSNFRHGATASMSFASIIFNAVVIHILWRIMKQRQTQAQIHLLFLAFSDLFVAIFFVCAAIWSWTNPTCQGTSNWYDRRAKWILKYICNLYSYAREYHSKISFLTNVIKSNECWNLKELVGLSVSPLLFISFAILSLSCQKKKSYNLKYIKCLMYKLSITEKLNHKQVTRSHNIVADMWAGATSIPHAPPPIHIHKSN